MCVCVNPDVLIYVHEGTKFVSKFVSVTPGLEFGKSQRAVENREKRRKLVAKSSVVPQLPSRLRD